MESQTIPPPFPIETERLWLRLFVENDFEDLCAFQTSPAVARYRYAEPRSREETRTLLDGWLGNSGFEADDDKLVLAVALKDKGRVIGQVGLTLRSARHRQGEIGFLLHPDFHGRGLAGEACRSLLEFGFKHLGLHRVYGRCNARNTASAQLMERLGLCREAELRENQFVKGEWTSELVYAALASEWMQSGAN
ncbi:GNAT family N-acetyltransferase [Pelagibius sp. CAU 1746]|uniref:GNAT family N-acetyltransferase n=1 Tax=Pelagibius sp. CAU 1746 TaxID=3140370 RepID=UPI00325A905D